MTVQVVEAEVRQCATEIDSAATQAEAVQPGQRVLAVAEALPGSTSAGAAGSLAEDWDDELTRWVRKAREQAETLRSAAAEITEADVVARQRFAHRPGMQPV